MEEHRWIDDREPPPLHAPKGIALTSTAVWVADIDTVRGFDRRSGRPVAQVPIPRATFLNDIAVGRGGELYVTDSGVAPNAAGDMVPTGTDAVYRIDRNGRVCEVAAGTHLNQPNGIDRLPGGRLLVGTRGADQVLTLDGSGDVIERRTVPGRVVDGVKALPDHQVAVTTWQQPGLWRLNRDGTSEELIPGLEFPGAADFSFDGSRSRLLLPQLLENEVRAVHFR